ncbi:neuronal acetylcholine receptor subunit beta-3-like isoform X4 [Mercenaria mercenaria]|uniref:neuronal acetylcholine receptor subunit beta-3-like isoform X4 n=1 Tax=Mercenaria mercenaria TaxID=6596 RepID=UPI00234F7ACE|nr:neuronal acetylcholine receptor subunit beta-3-like isoform X4 [Mercenaria mercenaria]
MNTQDLNFFVVIVYVSCIFVRSAEKLNGTTLLRKDGYLETSMEKKLIRTLLDEYEARGKMGRPIVEQNDTLTVYYGLSLIQILDLDERNQVLATNVWASYGWKDIYMSWDPELYANITKVRVPSNRVWTPDIKLYNYADIRLEEKRETLVVVQHDGSIQWIPQAIYKSSCSINIQYFPFDVQTCKMKFGSWTYDGSKIMLELLYENAEGFDFTEYIPNNEWMVATSSAKKNVLRYACCPGEPFVDITFYLKIRRQPAFYNYILILPCILLSSLTLVLFWLPPESPAKMQLGMNIFVAFFVLLLLLAESTPPSASSIPLIGAYYCLNMILITLSAFLSVIVVNLYFHGAKREVPFVVKKIVIDGLARLFCMRGEFVKLENASREIGSRRYNVVPAQCNKEIGSHMNDNHVPYTDIADEEIMIRTLSDGQSEKPETLWLTSLAHDIRDIRSQCEYLVDKQTKQDKLEKTIKEWRLVAVVLDRLFFVIYLIIMVVSISTVFDFVLFGKDGNSSS